MVSRDASGVAPATRAAAVAVQPATPRADADRDDLADALVTAPSGLSSAHGQQRAGARPPGDIDAPRRAPGHARAVAADGRDADDGDRRRGRAPRGHITNAGPRELRSLLVQAARACWRSPASGTLRVWVERLAGRRGKRIAVVALARRLSRILFAVWRDQSVFDAATLAA